VPTATDTATESTTPTESDTPSETATRAEPSYPLGLSNDGIEPLLADTHTRVLGSEGFTAQWSKIDRAESEIRRRKQYRVQDGIAVGTWTNENGGDVGMFRSNEGGFWRESLGSSYTYGKSREGFDMSRVAWMREVEPLLRAADWTEPELQQRGEPATWRVDASGVADSTAVPSFYSGRVTSLSGSAVVDERGFLQSLDVNYDLRTEHSGRRQFRSRYAVEDVGRTTVQTPGWVSTAKEKRPVVSAALTDDSQFVRLRHESGNPLEPGTHLTLFDTVAETNVYTYQLRDPLAAGEAAYLYRDGAGGDHLARGSRPGGVSTTTFDSNYKLWALRGSVEYFGVVSV
jgi:hypothetical protein